MTTATAPTASTTPPAAALSLRLKTETQPLHTAAERHLFHQLLFTGALPLDRLAAQHAAAGRVQLAVEHALDAATSPEVRAVYRDHHRRSALYARDVLGLGAAPDAGASPEEAAFVSQIAAWASNDPVALLGALYVLEGSTNGGPFIQKAVARVSPGLSLTALNPHGDQQAPRWAQFKTALDALSLTGPQQDSVVRAASATFWALCSMMSVATAGLAPVSRASTPAH